MMCTHCGPSPLVALKVDEDSDQPGFLTSLTPWYGTGAPGSPQEGVLHQVAGIIGIGCQTSCESIKTIGMGVEQQCQSFNAVGDSGLTDEGCLDGWSGHHLHKRVKGRFCW